MLLVLVVNIRNGEN